MSESTRDRIDSLVRLAEEIGEKAGTAMEEQVWADDAGTKYRGPDAFPLARKAAKIYRAAARLAGDPERGTLFAIAAEYADMCEADKLTRSIIREACQCDLEAETAAHLKDYWWFCAGHDKPFPEPKPRGAATLMDRRGPIEGQGSFAWEVDT